MVCITIKDDLEILGGKMKKVSIIIPVYNSENTYRKRLIRSEHKQCPNNI